MAIVNLVVETQPEDGKLRVNVVSVSAGPETHQDINLKEIQGGDLMLECKKDQYFQARATWVPNDEGPLGTYQIEEITRQVYF